MSFGLLLSILLDKAINCMTLRDYLKKEIELPEETINRLDNLMKYEELPKGHQLFQEGSKSKKLIFVEKGILRLYYYKNDKDITHHFITENSIYTPIENVFLNEPYRYNVELIEDCVLRSVDFSTLEKHLDEDIYLQRFARLIAVSTIKMLADHLYSIQFQSAQERYNILMEKHSDILLRVPLGHIASYLGITQQTLSVIRAGKGK